MKYNVAKSGEIRPCTSCQVCSAVCPANAISIELNTNGFYRPVVDNAKCVDCGLCVKSCYKYAQEIRSTVNFSGKKQFAATAVSKEVLKNTTSGGIADLLALELIKQGYKCIGVVFDSDQNCALGKVAATADEVVGFRGSKYIQSLSVEAFRELVKQNKHQKYAVFGLPCQIYGLNRALTLRKSRDSHILIDLYCHGCPSLNVWRKYTESILEKTGGTKILSANFRSKVRGWGNYVVQAKVQADGKLVEVASPRINDPFFTLFFSDLVLNDSCSSCELRSTLEYCDIRLGDFWGLMFVKNHTGVSGVTVCTERGQGLLDKIRGNISISEVDFNTFLPYQSYGKVYKQDEQKRKVLLNTLGNSSSSIQDVVKTYRRLMPLKYKIVTSLKNIIKLLPNSVVSNTKALFYKVR
ncbi:MAG: 4Fe-4S dicluster domain-containing protein [Bacteroides sp.]|nr:4Fe-4S dicluster domain-containing protein [Bacteroidales bacterium]MBD5317010.1 4Fe-4S dicluster domain-containing protein [Bacteroides sp.]